MKNSTFDSQLQNLWAIFAGFDVCNKLGHIVKLECTSVALQVLPKQFLHLVVVDLKTAVLLQFCLCPADIHKEVSGEGIPVLLYFQARRVEILHISPDVNRDSIFSLQLVP